MNAHAKGQQAGKKSPEIGNLSPSPLPQLFYNLIYIGQFESAAWIGRMVL